MRLVFAGTPEVAATVLRELISRDELEIVAVLTRPDARRGRGRKLYPSPVKDVALEHGLEVLETSSLKPGSDDADAVRARLKELAPDCIPVVAYGALIPEDLLDLPTHGWVNLHFSLLPAWRGAAPVQAAIAAGDQVTGVTAFVIDAGLDTGAILATKDYEISDTVDSGQLLDELAQVGAPVLADSILALHRGEITPQPQQGEATYAGKITTADAHIDFTQPAAVVSQTLRAVTPHPGGWVTLGEARMKLRDPQVVDSTTFTEQLTLAPGEVQVVQKKLVVGCGENTAVVIGQVQPAGKNMMEATAWVRGLKTTEGLMFQ